MPEFFDIADEVRETGEHMEFAKEANDAAFNSTQAKDSFENLNTQLTNIDTKNEIGNITVDNTDLKVDGKSVDISKFNDYMRDGDLKSAIEVLNPDIKLDDPTLKTLDEYKIQFQKQTGYVDIKNVKDTETEGKANSNKLGGDPTSVDDLNNKLNANPDAKETIDKAIKALDDKIKEDSKSTDSKTIGKWVKESAYKLFKMGLKIAVGLAISAELFKLIKDHQNQMNGCWLINIKTGEKCKLSDLTCDSDQANANDNPCPIDGEDIPDTTCVSYSPSPSSSPASCITISEDNGCSGSNCSKYCSPSRVNCPSGYTLQCVNVDFFGALSDLCEQPLDFGSNLLKNVLNILKYILYGVLIILAIFLIFKLIMFILDKTRKNKDQNS